VECVGGKTILQISWKVALKVNVIVAELLRIRRKFANIVKQVSKFTEWMSLDLIPNKTFHKIAALGTPFAKQNLLLANRFRMSDRSKSA